MAAPSEGLSTWTIVTLLVARLGGEVRLTDEELEAARGAADALILRDPTTSDLILASPRRGAEARPAPERNRFLGIDLSGPGDVEMRE